MYPNKIQKPILYPMLNTYFFAIFSPSINKHPSSLQHNPNRSIPENEGRRLSFVGRFLIYNINSNILPHTSNYHVRAMQ